MLQGLGKGIGSFTDARHPDCTEDMPENEQKGHRQATLTISCDQCAMNSCMIRFLLLKVRVHCLVITDYFHRLWNDCRSSSSGSSSGSSGSNSSSSSSSSSMINSSTSQQQQRRRRRRRQQQQQQQQQLQQQ